MKTLMNKLLIISTLALSMSLFAKPDQHTCEKIRSLMFNESNNRFTWGCTDFVEQGSKFDLSRDMNQIFINELIENEKDNDLKNSATDGNTTQVDFNAQTIQDALDAGMVSDTISSGVILISSGMLI